MQEDLTTQIQQAAARVRAQDFLWAAGIGAGVAIAAGVSGTLDWRSAPVVWGAFVAALYVRYRFSAARVWVAPIQNILDRQLGAKEAELATLRMTRGIAQSLPDPIFILDIDSVIVLANPAAEEFLGNASIEGRHLAAALRASPVIDAAEHVLRDGQSQMVEFTLPGSVERFCRAYIAPVGLSDDNPAVQSSVLVFLRDLTSEHRLEQMRADFIASASHELRTPLASLLGFLETMLGPAKGDEKAQKKFLKIMQSQAERMQRLVSDLMSLSRIELNEHVPPNDIVDLAATAEDVIEGSRPIFEKSGAIVDFVREGGQDTLILGDTDEITQAFQNLIDNAVKYGGDPAMVKVKVGRGPAPTISEDQAPAHRAGDSVAQVAARIGVDVEDLVYLQVRDFGPGIERAELPRVTERFYRISIESSRKSGGTGLGLAIVKHIINRHKGGFQVESRLAGGSAFTCYFGPLNN